MLSLNMAEGNQPSGPPPIDPTNIATTGPYAGLPVLPPGFVWNQYPWHPSFMSDPEWYDTLGVDALERRQVFKITDENELHRALGELLDEFPNKGMEMMFQSAVKGRADAIRWLLQKGVRAHPVDDGEAEEGDDMTCVPVHAAAFNGNLECLKVLVEEAGVSVNVTDDLGGTPLMRAATGKRTDIVRWLLEKGADPTPVQEMEGGAHFSALDFAAHEGDPEGLKIIFEVLEEKFTAEEKDTRSIVTSQLLQAAAYSGKVDALQFLLSKGGFPPDGVTELNAAQRDVIEMALRRAQKAEADLLRILLSYFTKPDVDGRLQYFHTQPETTDSLVSTAMNAIGRGDTETFELVWQTTLDDPGPDMETIEIRSGENVPKQEILNAMLFEAAKGGHLDAVKLMAQYGASFDEAHGPSFTPLLYIAAAKNHVEVLRYLLDIHNPDIDRAGGRYANGPTALAIAIIEGFAEAAKLLLMHGGPVEQIEHQVDSEKATRLVLSAAKVYRQQIKVVFADATYEVEVEPGVDVVSVDLVEGDTDWLSFIRKRKSDEELAKIDPFGRELRVPEGSS